MADQISKNNLIVVKLDFLGVLEIAEFKCDSKISKFKKIVMKEELVTQSS